MEKNLGGVVWEGFSDGIMFEPKFDDWKEVATKNGESSILDRDNWHRALRQGQIWEFVPAEQGAQHHGALSQYPEIMTWRQTLNYLTHPGASTIYHLLKAIKSLNNCSL